MAGGDPNRLLAAARRGEDGAFDQLVRPLLPRLNAFALRIVANPDDAAEIVQDALLKAYQAISTYRGKSSFSTWLFSIVTRRCLDHLRARQRWRWDAQVQARQSGKGPHPEIQRELRDPSSVFDAREHIAFCFSCVSRSLAPEEAAALLLREVFGYANKEAAKICGTSEPVLRHRLSAARHAMQDAFDDLCGLVSKTGVCHQCAMLRDACPDTSRGAELPVLGGDRDERWRVRLQIVGDADLAQGISAKLHRLMYQAVAASES